MGKQNDDIARRAWSVLRLALLWARKGGVFKRRLMMELRLVPKFIKSIGNGSHSSHRDRIRYGERQLSFDKTPIFHVKMHRPSSMRFHLPCLTAPQVDFDYDFFCDDNEVDSYSNGAYGQCNDSCRKSFLKGTGDDEEGDETASYGEESIDTRAEEFIAKFYEQMKLQRQISYLQYNEMLCRGTS